MARSGMYEVLQIKIRKKEAPVKAKLWNAWCGKTLLPVLARLGLEDDSNTHQAHTWLINLLFTAQASFPIEFAVSWATESTEQAQDSTCFTSCWGASPCSFLTPLCRNCRKDVTPSNQPCPTVSWHWQTCSLHQGGVIGCSHISAALDAPRWVQLLLPLPVSSLETSAAIPSGRFAGRLWVWTCLIVSGSGAHCPSLAPVQQWVSKGNGEAM